jgi:sortase (surface protein transpeptidase)
MKVVPTIRALSEKLPGRGNRFTLAALLLLASLVFLGAGLTGLLMARDSDEDSVRTVGTLDVSTDGLLRTATPKPTPLPSAAPPTRMIIEKIGVDAPIIPMTLQDGTWSYYGPDEVGWIGSSGKPGWGSNAVFYGHVDWIDRGAVFYNIRTLEPDDAIHILLEDGTEYRYSVSYRTSLEWSDPKVREMEEPTPKDVITLLTCGGSWVPDSSERYGGEYTDAVIVRAERLAEGVARTSQAEGSAE